MRPIDERVKRPAPVVVDGRPVKLGDELWFGDEKVTARWFCEGHIMTDYTTTDAEGEEIVYPFDPSELSWERPAPKVLDADGRARQVVRECRMRLARGGGWYCSECSVWVAPGPMANATERMAPRYCPNCGAKVVD